MEGGIDEGVRELLLTRRCGVPKGDINERRTGDQNGGLSEFSHDGTDSGGDAGGVSPESAYLNTVFISLLLELVETNINGTLNLLMACRKLAAERVVRTSTRIIGKAIEYCNWRNNHPVVYVR